MDNYNPDVLEIVDNTLIGYNYNRDVKNVVIPDGVKKIKSMVFMDKPKLESIVIPASVEEIESGAICCDKDLKEIKVNPGNKRYVSIDDGNLIDTKEHVLLASCKDCNIPEDINVKTIAENAFSNGQIKSICIPKTVKSLSSDCFYLYLPIENLSVAEGNTTYHSSGNCIIDTAEKVLVVGCKTSVIPSDGSVLTIGYGAFKHCNDLKKITIPSPINCIEEHAFSYCVDLEEITFPSTVHSLEATSFFWCNCLTLHISSQCRYEKDDDEYRGDTYQSYTYIYRKLNNSISKIIVYDAND